MQHDYYTQPVKRSDVSYETMVKEMFQEETGCSDEYLKNLKWGQILGETELTITKKSGFKKRIKLSRELITSLSALDNGVGLVFPSLGGYLPKYPHSFLYHQRHVPYRNEKAQIREFKRYQEYMRWKEEKYKGKNRGQYLGNDRIGFVGSFAQAGKNNVDINGIV